MLISTLECFYSWTVQKKNRFGHKLSLIVRWDFHYCNKIKQSWASDLNHIKGEGGTPSECRFLMNLASSRNTTLTLFCMYVPCNQTQVFACTHTRHQNTTDWSIVFRCLICILNNIKRLSPPCPTLYVIIYSCNQKYLTPSPQKTLWWCGWKIM